MTISRRDFMKVFGASIAGLILARCSKTIRTTPTVTCYEPVVTDDSQWETSTPSPGPTCYTATAVPPTTEYTPLPESLPGRERLRLLWLRLGDLAYLTAAGKNEQNALGTRLSQDHHLALEEVTSSGEISGSVRELVQEAYDAAVAHVWRGNINLACYTPAIIDYAPASAEMLLQQVNALESISGQGTVDPATLEKARAALGHDLAFYALTNAEVNDLYDRLLRESQENASPLPPFEEIDLELTSEAESATQFIIDLLMGK